MRIVLLACWLLAWPAWALPEAAPDVALKDLAGQPVRLSSLARQGPLTLVWWCSTCPSCRTVDAGLAELARRGRVYAVCASAGETPDTVRDFQRKHALEFPVLFDPTWALTEPFAIKATTTTLILDSHLRVRYFGRFAQDQQNHARNALTQLEQGQPVAVPRTQPFGCIIPRP